MQELNFLPPKTGLAESPRTISDLSTAFPAQEALDQTLAHLQAHKDAWPQVGVELRIEYLDEIIRRVRASAGEWVSAALEHKGPHPASGASEGEEWLFVGIILRAARRLRRSLEQIRAYGSPELPHRLARVRPGGGLVIETFPDTPLERLLFLGMHGQVWLERDVEPQEIFDLPLMGNAISGRVCLVLGSGNVPMPPFLDVLTKLFVENQVVLLKLNPANDYLGVLFERAFQPLIQAGFVALAYGGAEVGAYLCQHPAVDSLHMTGSDKTYEAIVFGAGPEGAARKAAHQPLIDKPFTAELGGVNPFIVVPGPWRARQVRQKATSLATHQYMNASFNCLTPRLVIQAQEWAWREAFIRAMGAALSQAGTRPSYYPGAITHYQAILDSRRGGSGRKLTFGTPTGEDTVPWTVLYDLDPEADHEALFQTESFCALTGEVGLPAASPAEFLRRAVDFANQRLWGDLSATILVHPASLRDAETRRALDEAVEHLEYGLITINTVPGYAYGAMLPPFGAPPGHPPEDIQSGTGKVNNFYFLRRPYKAVLKAPFNAPDLFLLSNPGVAQAGRATFEYFAEPSLWNFLRLVKEMV